MPPNPLQTTRARRPTQSGCWPRRCRSSGARPAACQSRLGRENQQSAAGSDTADLVPPTHPPAHLHPLHPFRSSSLHGNPHSEAGWAPENRSAAADAARLATLRWCNADPEHYCCIFTAGATGARWLRLYQALAGPGYSWAWLSQDTGACSQGGLLLLPPIPPRQLMHAALLPTAATVAALKLVGESFPWGPASAFVHLRDNHTRQAPGGVCAPTSSVKKREIGLSGDSAG